MDLARPLQELLYLLAVIKSLNKNSYDYLRCSTDHEGVQNDITIKLTAFRKVPGSVEASY